MCMIRMNGCNECRIPKKNLDSYEEEMVNTSGPYRVHSTHPTQIKDISYVKHDSLMNKVLERENLERAYKRVIANKGAAGIDGMNVLSLKAHLDNCWPTLKDQLKNGAYNPKPARRVEIPKSNGGKRGLGIPTVTDRFIQQAIQQVLTPIFEQTFSNASYGFRSRKSAHQAVRQAHEYVKQGYTYVVDTDLEKFFDQVNHDRLMEKLYQYIDDKILLRLIRKYLQAGVLIDGLCKATERGTPQGGPLSPLLSNIVLDELDKELGKRGHKFVRYADDCNIYVRSKRAGERVFKSVKQFIERKLKLKVNEQKSAVDIVYKRKILSFRLLSEWIVIADQAATKLKDKIRQLTNKTWSISMRQRIDKINEYTIGWMGYFHIASCKNTMEKIDQWIRRRLRAVLLKTWKRCKTKLQRLVALGINKDWAGCVAYSRKKYWRLSNTPQINKALGLSYWKEQGLLNLLDLYHAKTSQKTV